MRSVAGLAAFALAGILQVHVVGASKCKPSSQISSATGGDLTQSIPTSAVSTVSAVSASDSSNINSDTKAHVAPTTTFSTHSTGTGTGTPTSLLATVTQSGDVVVVNVIKNGNFAKNLDSYSTGGTSGGATYNGDDGYTGDDSTEHGCAALSASGAATSTTSAPVETIHSEPPSRRRKRQDAVSDLVTISQDLTGLDTSKAYTVRFYYRIESAPTDTQDCRLLLEFNDLAFWSAFLVEPASTPSAWIEAIQSVDVPAADSTIKFTIRCDHGGSASILIDSVFMSNKVTPSTIDQYVLDYGNSATGSITSFAVTSHASVTAALPPLRTAECGHAGEAGVGLSDSEFAAYDRSTATLSSLRDCIESCQDAYQYCGAVSWDSATKTCITYKGTPEQIGFQEDSASTTNFYSSSCLKQDKFEQCGQMGSITATHANSYYIGSFGPQVQPIVCKQVCVGINMGCVMFGWNSVTGICDTFKGTIEDSGFTAADVSQELYYELSCVQ